MRTSVSIALTEARQEVDLAVLLMPGAAFLALDCLALRAALISFGCICGFGIGLMRFELAALLALSFIFACLFFGILGSRSLHN